MVASRWEGGRRSLRAATSRTLTASASSWTLWQPSAPGPPPPALSLTLLSVPGPASSSSPWVQCPGIRSHPPPFFINLKKKHQYSNYSQNISPTSVALPNPLETQLPSWHLHSDIQWQLKFHSPYQAPYLPPHPASSSHDSLEVALLTGLPASTLNPAAYSQHSNQSDPFTSKVFSNESHRASISHFSLQKCRGQRSLLMLQRCNQWKPEFGKLQHQVPSGSSLINRGEMWEEVLWLRRT